MLKKMFWLILIFILAACDAAGTNTNNSASDPQSAQNLLPNIVGYTRSDAANILDAITSAGGGAALISGNPLIAGVIGKLDSVIECYQGVGAVAAGTYVQADISSVIQGNIPSAGVVAVINQTRLQNNFLACLTGGGGSGFGAQSADLQPCTGNGEFTFQGERITYIYAATSPLLCGTFQQHFDSIQKNNS